MSSYFIAEDFTLTQAVTLNMVRFWNLQEGIPGCCYKNSITWGIYSNGAAKPGAPLAGPTNTVNVTRTPTNSISNEYQNDFALPSVSLAAGTYWLALYNGPGTATGSDNFYWEFSGSAPAGGSPGRVCTPSSTVDCTSTTDWGPYSTTEYAFQLYGEASSSVVPEPSTLLLIGSVLPGIVGVGTLIRKRRTHSTA
jgi:hypothetical protein